MKLFTINDFSPYFTLFPKLSKREIEVLSMSRAGLTRSEIALELNLSVSTVDNYFNNAMHKYELESSCALRAFFNFIIQDSFIKMIIYK
ncbi:helix-turn-helix transcriptional regulator [Candidatus Williamhamiltonella defendens]|uniref:Helix-turn-helix transcriptional regulator n=1 Tax=Candidatus Williamhamiltonella defendens TaxID=138072 RepID=A0A2D3T452_9ENTR|nr:helix-turn-helix transcriptional regulator [Candidatus Hamiltonella defensa]ATW30494.1 helix-turn-helix transcriptional regulator [Candidatus Hamiltonella defensa]ATW32503.1 helix-turn-helix transcriptional regulator [Candidatus Hamiltonella defensa]